MSRRRASPAKYPSWWRSNAEWGTAARSSPFRVSPSFRFVRASRRHLACGCYDRSGSGGFQIPGSAGLSMALPRRRASRAVRLCPPSSGLLDCAACTANAAASGWKNRNARFTSSTSGPVRSAVAAACSGWAGRTRGGDRENGNGGYSPPRLRLCGTTGLATVSDRSVARKYLPLFRGRPFSVTVFPLCGIKRCSSEGSWSFSW